MVVRAVAVLLSWLALGGGLVAQDISAPFYRDPRGVRTPAVGVFCMDLAGSYAVCGSPAASTVATGQATAGASAGVLVPARSGRSAVTIQQLGTTPVYLGPSGVTTATGFPLPGVVGASVTLPTAATIYGVTASGTQAVAFVETF